MPPKKLPVYGKEGRASAKEEVKQPFTLPKSHYCVICVFQDLERSK